VFEREIALAARAALQQQHGVLSFACVCRVRMSRAVPMSLAAPLRPAGDRPAVE
jgi:hypothetical protein